MHTSDENSTSPYKLKKSKYQIRFVKNEDPDSKTSDTKAYLGYYSMFNLSFFSFSPASKVPKLTHYGVV